MRTLKFPDVRFDKGALATPTKNLADIVAACEAVVGKKELPGNRFLGSQFSVVAGTRNQRYLQIAEGWMPRAEKG